MGQITKKIVSVLTLCGLLFFQCKNDDIKTPCKLEDVRTPFVADCKLTKDLDTARMLISGTWIWLQEERRQRGKPVEYLTPKNQDYSRTLELNGEIGKFYKCDELQLTRKFDIVKLKVITGTDYPEDEDPVLVMYDLESGVRTSHVPLRICNNYLILQGQYVSSIGGEETWKRK